MAIRTCLVLFNIGTFAGGDVGRIFDIAREADAAGVDTISVVDHVAMGREAYEQAAAGVGNYPLGKTVTPHPGGELIYEAMCFLTAIAMITKRIRLSHSVLIAPLRSVPLLAKQAATVDQFSGGRLEMALGAGWQQAEFVASNVSFDARFRILEEQVEAMRLLWTEAPASYAGKYVQFKELWGAPWPMQKKLPVWLGLKPTEHSAPRLARLADGWIPDMSTPDIVRAGIDRIRHEAKKIGRDLTGYGFRGSPQPVKRADGSYDVKATMATFPKLIEAGLTEISMGTTRTILTEDDLSQALKGLAELKKAYA
jgi:probable F420-dependent oxidoreductase